MSSSHLSAPLGDVSRARLELPGGAYQLRLRSHDDSPPRADEGQDNSSRGPYREPHREPHREPYREPAREPPELFRAHFEGMAPQVAVHDGTVRIFYPRFHGFDRRGTSGEIALARTVPWTIAMSGGAAHVDADLTQLELEGMSLSGGMSVVRLLLPRPAGRVTLLITGGVHRLEILRPAVTPVRLNASGGIQDLRVDELVLGAVGGKFKWESPTGGGPDGYDIGISGGASGLTVAPLERWTPAPEEQTEAQPG